MQTTPWLHHRQLNVHKAQITQIERMHTVTLKQLNGAGNQGPTSITKNRTK